ncbi:DUF916 and DUF3324 domain-containing protein [Vagococcus intermedius]|uniref:DUF916 and DUF3324 domain-containing protein n=1 Tax=Vagococcus intermedius TaxID=2991418 RepID=A0AAF0CVE8_9ENTE|nr:DUF916 and DUF3324 domain-containing protein [Vagococcus intermedius]WEG73601.1 DUF916 and DUF3324 domain-containing protein [Vagococcus intermedius]WEG75685.1 DUF916 and DUF3324 domain-containing protein [Vagococcus intermedius]
MKKFMIKCAIVLASLTAGSVSVLADEMTFQVDTVAPEKQMGENSGIYNLRLEPGEKTTVEVKVSNSADENRTIQVTPTDSKTLSSGSIDYTPSDKTKDKKEYKFESLAKTDKLVEFKAHETKNIPVEITMPAKEFKGVILGGLYLQEAADSAKSKSDKAEGMTINNKYAFTVPVMLSNNDEAGKAELKLNSVKADNVSGYNKVVAEIESTQKNILKEATIEGKVTRKGEKEVLHEHKLENVSFAPESKMNFGIDWTKDSFKPGTYVTAIKVTSPYGNWDWTKEFTIADKESKKMNEKAVDIEPEKPNYLMYGIFGLLLIVVLLLIYLIVSKRKKEAKEKND